MALTVALSCAAALMLLLAVPIHLHVAVERERAVQTRLRLSWLFGLVRFPVHPSPGRARTKPKEKRPGHRRRRRARIARRLAGGLLRRDLRESSFALLRRVFRAVQPRDMRLHACIGMGDPADTGQLWAVLGPLSVLLWDRDIRIEPHFEGACLRFQAAARVRLIPAQLLFLGAAFLVSPPVIRAVVAR